MWYRWHFCRLCCSHCTRTAGERRNWASPTFRTDYCWWSLHDGDDLPHFPAYPFGRWNRVTAGTFGLEKKSLSAKERLGQGSSCSFWVQGLSWVPLLKSQNWESLYFHGRRETVGKRDHNGYMFVFWPTPRTCFWPPPSCQIHNQKRGDTSFCSLL